MFPDDRTWQDTRVRIIACTTVCYTFTLDILLQYCSKAKLHLSLVVCGRKLNEGNLGFEERRTKLNGCKCKGRWGEIMKAKRCIHFRPELYLVGGMFG